MFFQPAEKVSGGSSARWWVGSLLFHGALVGWLLFYSPVRLFNPAAKPKVNVSPKQAQQVVDNLRKKQSVSIEQQLKTLEADRQKVVSLEKRKREEFLKYAEALAKDLPAQAAHQIQTVEQGQAEALAALEKASQDSRQFVCYRAGTFFDDMVADHKLVAEKQSRILQLQDQMQSLLVLGGEGTAEALQLQNEAAAAQNLANTALAAAVAARNPSYDSRRRTEREGMINHFAFHVHRSGVDISSAVNNVAVADRQLASAKTMLARVEAFVAKSSTNGSSTNLATARQYLDRARRNVRDAQWQVDDAPKRVVNARKDLPGYEANLKLWMGKPEPAPAELTFADERLLTLGTNAYQAQLAAQLAQQSVARAFSTLKNVASNAPSANQSLAVLDQQAPSEAVPSLIDVRAMTLAEKYETAVKLEASLVQSYRRLRAVDLAMIRQLSVGKAVALTDVAKPVRPDLGAALQMSIATGDQAVQAREAVQNAKSQIGAMVELASSIVSQAKSLDESTGSPVTMTDINSQNEELLLMEAMAAQGRGQWSKNLAGAMRSGKAGRAGKSGQSGEGGEGECDGGDPGDPGAGGPGGPAGQNGTGNGGNGMPDLGATGDQGPFRGMGVGSGTPGGFQGSGVYGVPPEVTQQFKALPGRRVAARGNSPAWLYVDSWYIIGPFDNTDRQNIDRKFPPETIVDLNATYPGKNGVPIRWEFNQSGTPNVRPLFKGYNAVWKDPLLTPLENFRRNYEYCIYYAYTELFFEKECDLWVAVGSDDFSKLWIEDYLVWSSGTDLKAWQTDEGVRKVHFKKGINRILYRIENGNNLTEFSLVVSMLP